MVQEIEQSLGKNTVRVSLVMAVCVWVWHSFFSGVAEVGTAQNVTAQGQYAAQRELALAEKAKAEACSARMTASVANRPQNRLLEGDEQLRRDCDPTYVDAKVQEILDPKVQELLNSHKLPASPDFLAACEKDFFPLMRQILDNSIDVTKKAVFDKWTNDVFPVVVACDNNLTQRHRQILQKALEVIKARQELRR